MVDVEVIRELPTVRRRDLHHTLVRCAGYYYVVSSVDWTLDRGPETLVFPADESGEIEDWMDVAGGPGMSRDEAIRDLRRAVESGRIGADGLLVDRSDEDEEEDDYEWRK